MKTEYYNRQRFRRLRGSLIAAGISHEDLADILHMSSSALSNRFCAKLPWRLDEMYSILAHIGVEKPEAVLGYYFPRNGQDQEVGGCP